MVCSHRRETRACFASSPCVQPFSVRSCATTTPRQRRISFHHRFVAASKFGFGFIASIPVSLGSKRIELLLREKPQSCIEVLHEFGVILEGHGLVEDINAFAPGPCISRAPHQLRCTYSTETVHRSNIAL